MLSYCLIKKCFQDASHIRRTDVDFLLEENDWNDYSFYTTYHLHITPKRFKESKGAVYCGSINIMKIGQKEGERYLLRTYFNKGVNYSVPFSALPKGFYSITFSLDLYKVLSLYLNEEERREFIESFRFILEKTDKFYPIVKDEEVFRTSLLRDSTMSSYSLLKGRSLLLMEGFQYNLRKQQITERIQVPTNQ